MRNFVLAEVELPAARFLHADAAGAVFQDARLESSDFSDANLVGASFRGARVGGADFTRANIHRADFRGAVLNDSATGAVKLPQNLPCTDFSGVDFTGVPLAEAVFVSGSVANARFADADLSGAAFPRTEVTGADFSRAAGLEDPHQLAEACVRGPLPRLPAGFEWNGSDCRDFAPTRGTDCLNP